MTSPQTRVDAGPVTVDTGDVEELIGLAARMAQVKTDTLTIDELKDIGAQLDLAPEHLERTVAALALRRQQAREREAAAELARAARARSLRRAGLAALAVLVVATVLTVALGFSTESSLRNQWQAANAAQQQLGAVQARVAEAQQRQSEVNAMLAGPDAPALASDRAALLEGALNRVSIARRRTQEPLSNYRTLAAQYNLAVQRGWGQFWARRAALPTALEVPGAQ